MKSEELAQFIVDKKSLEKWSHDFAEGVQKGDTVEWVKATPLSAMRSLSEIGEGSVRIKPELTPIDMSVLIGSYIDCEFGGAPDIGWRIGYLINIDHTDKANAYHIKREDGSSPYAQCRPRMYHWHSFLNCPGNSAANLILLENAGFSVVRDGMQFKFNGLVDGRCMPWEVKA